MWRRLLRFFGHGPFSDGLRCVDARDDGSGSVHQLSSGGGAPVLERYADLRSTDLLRAISHASRSPLLQNC
jgi:hypothetical protein